MSSRVLYWGSGSTPCWRAMIVLAEKGLEYQSIKIEFDKQEHKSDKIKALNARGQVPTFKDGEISVNESAGICDYLENSYKDKKIQLLPSSPKELASVLQRKYETQNLEKKLMSDFLYYFWMNKDKTDEKEVEKKVEALKEELKIWDDYLKDKKYITGNDFTMADVFLFPLIAWAFRLGLNGENYKNISKYHNTCKERPSIQDSWPPHWKDGPSKMLICEKL